jgi:arginine utilization protein RocB
MSQATVNGQTRQELEISKISLFDVLHNSLILRTISPYLPICSLLQLAATNTQFQSLIHNTPGVFRHLDLTSVKKAQFDINPIDNGGEVWRNVQLDENLTEDE